MYKIGVIGKRESVTCFAVSGFEVGVAESVQRASELLKEMAEDNCAVIFITEELAAGLSETIDGYKSSYVPAVITIPPLGGGTGYGMNALKRACERVVGMDILK